MWIQKVPGVVSKTTPLGDWRFRWENNRTEIVGSDESYMKVPQCWNSRLHGQSFALSPAWTALLSCLELPTPPNIQHSTQVGF